MAAAALVIGCASDSSAPDWLQGPAEDYPSERYSVGVGASPNAKTAAVKAMQSIAEQTGGETEGAEIVETWADPRSGVEWALAALDREAALERLQDELNAVDERIVRETGDAGGRPPLEALAALARASNLLAERDLLRARISRLGGVLATPDAAVARQKTELDTKIANTKRRLRVEIDAFEIDAKTGEPGERLDDHRRSLVQRTLEMGFSVDSADTAWGTSEIWLRVESKVATDRLELLPTDTLAAVRWSAVLEITDIAGGGDKVAVLSEEGRATHLNEQEARRLAERDARNFAVAALEGWLTARVAGQEAATATEQ